ncbi:MAG: type II toxin-antitoxin system VapB family antitoxin [Gammaproteobacteria bacterium]|nr:type II toxin-antitoxin system VapB family antitoxin [Gammaproteobacteria bacterium]MXW46120.1 AbrB/MazE/SpoVT family DNA-binding domain-containing protein [Gammaproteobacteria bacterium]MYD02782.1 AbrB/MazE/SpoVT family DNA-binding domain-containing protein [Gammaproteobacteria bacterium]MYI26239.1 AbrB/MazE/SpoVT family DNA-binding domain-containing protein [Gammaproteobacteria bacterium]
MPIGSVFEHNGTQAVRLPADARFPANVKRVHVRVKGKERILSPAGHAWDSFFLEGPYTSEDLLATRAAQRQSDREPL